MFKLSIPLAGAYLAAAATIITIATPTHAEERDEFLRLHQSVRAHELCRNGGQAYSRDQQLKLARAIDRMAGGDLTAADRLESVLEAKSSVSRMRHAGSCSGEKLVDLIELFDTKLASAL